MTQKNNTQPLQDLLTPYQNHSARLNVAKTVLIFSDLLTLWGVLAITGYLSLIKVEHGWVAGFQTLKGDMELFRLGSFLLVSSGLIAWFWIVCRHYSNRRPYWDELKDIVQGIVAAFILDAALGFLSKNAFSRTWLISLWLSLLVLLPLIRWIVKSVLSRSSLVDQPYIIVGSGVEVQETIAALESEPLVGFKALAVILPYANDPQTSSDIVYSSSKNIPIPTYYLSSELEVYLCQIESIKVIFVLGDRDTEQALRLRKKWRWFEIIFIWCRQFQACLCMAWKPTIFLVMKCCCLERITI